MDRSQGEVWIYAEQEDGVLSDVALELLGKGRELAGTLGVPVAAVLLGSGVEGLAAKLFEYGADKVRLVDDPALRNYQNRSYRETMIELINEIHPQICVFGATFQGRDLAPSIASALRCGLTADCTELKIGDYTDPATKEEFKNLLMQCRPAFGGNIIATIVNPRNWPQMATVREGVMKMLDPVSGKSGELVKHQAKCLDGLELPVEVLEVVRTAKTVNLKGARVIVAGGAGVGSAENFKLLHELAEALGGTVGGTRAAVDLGYLEHERQIGQTGVTVRPALYIACGISGAVQHLAGMQESQKIIAINTDKDAPIFSVAHYGIVGDVCDVLPKIIKAVKAKAI
jgi:electron transfer flavoprotein alpha subunit